MLNTSYLRMLSRAAAVSAVALVFAFLALPSAADILDDWAAVKAPQPIELKPVTLDGATTALLILDMSKAGCTRRPRCVATVPNVKRLYDAARAGGAMLWYSLGDPKDIVDPGFTPREGEYIQQMGPDKFLGSNLEEKLKARAIKTVIVCGTSFQGVGIGTGTEAAQRGYKVIVPIDCLSSEDPYMEQYSAWQFFMGGPAVVTRGSTVTRSTMVKFGTPSPSN
jgi:nicotinamidase-related amidase